MIWRLHRNGAILGAVLIFPGYLGTAQKVISPLETPCSEESVSANLELKESHHIFGELKDSSGAPFVDSQMFLRRLGPKGTFVSFRRVVTNKEGRFDLGTVEAGTYRFLPSPNRGFKQPKEVHCWEARDCELNLTLQTNPTNQPYAGCPIQ